MPKALSTKSSRCIQRHYPPITNCCVFKSEQPIPRPLLTSQQIFSLTEGRLGEAQAPLLVPTALIEKPPGEVGRPSCNGYSLEETLNWGKDLYTSVQKDMRSLAKVHLNLDKLFSQQDNDQLAKVYKEAKEKHEVLKKYKEDWVQQDFLTTILKNSRSKRNHKPKDEAETSKKNTRNTTSKNSLQKTKKPRDDDARNGSDNSDIE